MFLIEGRPLGKGHVRRHSFFLYAKGVKIHIHVFHDDLSFQRVSNLIFVISINVSYGLRLVLVWFLRSGNYFSLWKDYVGNGNCFSKTKKFLYDGFDFEGRQFFVRGS